MVAYVLDSNLRHVRTIRKWRGEFGPTPPFDIGPNTLFVAYSAWAEMTCFLALGWTFPVHIFDQHTAYLAASNVLYPYNPDEERKKQRKRLSDACRSYGVAGWENIDKEAIARTSVKDIGAITVNAAVFEYCEEDVRAFDGAVPETATGISRYRARRRDARTVTGRTTAPRRSRRSKRAACRSTCSCGIWCRRTRTRSSSYLLKTFDPS